MYTTTVGKTFLKEYNEQLQTHYTAKTFFEEVFVPLFFDHQKYMMTGGNSPLENPKIRGLHDMIKGTIPFETPEKRKERIGKMIHKVDHQRADMSIAVGYRVANNESATSCQVTSLDLPNDADSSYLSWIGAAFGITVSGDITILFNELGLLWKIFEGWTYYRKYIEDIPLLKGNQVNIWNGQWIVHYYKLGFDETDPTAGLDPLGDPIKGIFNIKPISWIKLILGISHDFMGGNLMGYLYRINKYNSTYGFIPFVLDEITRPNLFYKKIFGENVFNTDIERIQEIYGTAFGLGEAIKSGSVGVKALEPFSPTLNNDLYKGKQNEREIKINTYLMWILAMLNNERLWDKSKQFAETFKKYACSDIDARTKNSRQITNALSSRKRDQFINNLTIILENCDDDLNESLIEIAQTVALISIENFPYFLTLIRFQYTAISKTI